MTNQPTKHTPGPWHTDIGHAVIGGQVMPLLGPDGASPEELWANSALIAAAPEMLSALRELTIAAEAAGWDVDKENKPILNAARAAIAKAGAR